MALLRASLVGTAVGESFSLLTAVFCSMLLALEEMTGENITR